VSVEMKRHSTIVCFALLIFALAPAAHAEAGDAIAPNDVKGPTTWGGAANVTQLGRLYFSGQPDQAGLAAARGAGVDVVINLRAPGELDWDEKAAVEALGMEYHNVPIDGARFTTDAIERIDALVAADEERKVYLHCSSSNRVGGWLAIHLATRDGLDEEAALAVARRAGITKEAIEKGVHAYLEER